MITSLMYFSRVTPGVKPDDIARIFREAHRRNGEIGISGVLYSDGRWFIQVLEGMRHHVSRIFGMISKDTRHVDVTLVSVREVECYQFREWSMGLIRRDTAVDEIVRDVLEAHELSPPDLNFAQLNALLVRFADERLRGVIPHFRARPPNGTAPSEDGMFEREEA